jgi:uncharacterized cysteine cluster protein YcgN (CxxCxxCC family)
MKTKKPKPFWEIKSLNEMTSHEWELLCDGCGRCCLHKLEAEETGKVRYTSVACRLLDIETCRCLRYNERRKIVPDCRILEPDTVGLYRWLPTSCAYRRLSEGNGLEWWHPLVSGDLETVHEAGMSVRDKIISERSINENDLEAYIMDCDI